jgi:hypothetical protein
MTTYFFETFAREYGGDGRLVEHKGESLTVRQSNRRAGMQQAELEVVRDGEVIGYITPYTRDERGAVAARDFGAPAPVIVRTLENALDEILRTQS